MMNHVVTMVEAMVRINRSQLETDRIGSSVLFFSFLAEVEFFKNSEWLWNANNIQFSFTGSRKTQYDQIQNYDQKK